MSNQTDLLRGVKYAWNRAYENPATIESLPWVNTEAPKSILSDFVRMIQRKHKEVRILDFGCGNGRLGRIIEKMEGCQVFYYDISEKVLDYCVKKGIPEERIIRDISECKDHFDGIVVWGVFHHLDPSLWESQLEQIVNLLEPEGALLFGDFTKEDGLFAREDSRESEVTQIPTYPVDYGFVGRRLHILDTKLFTFRENKECKYQRDFERRMKVVLAERYLVDQKAVIVRKMVDKLDPRPKFWHFVKYSFRDSLSAPYGKAVKFISESDPTVAQKLWLEGLTLFRHHDKLYPEETLWDKSLSEELFVRSVRKRSFYVHGEVGDRVSVKIEWIPYEGSGQHFDVHLQAPRLSLRKSESSTRQFPETDSFSEFISNLKDASKKCYINGDYLRMFPEVKEALKAQLKRYPIPTLPVLMMLMMVWPSKDSPRKFFNFIQPPVFQDNLGGNTIEVSAGGVVLYSNEAFLSFDSPLIPAINRWATLYTTLELVKYTRLKAVRAAIAQVMARNMSHNFGSHVLSYLISPDAYRKLGDEYVASLGCYGSLEGGDLSKDLFKDLTKGENHQAAYFMQYLKSRMDYLSEVTFGVSDLVTTKMLYGDVMRELDRARILLNHISGIGDFKYRFRVVWSDGKVDRPLSEKDLGIAFPNDVLGCQAFYNIVENIIRNTAKHNGGTTGCEDVVFTIRIRDVRSRRATVEGANELYCVEIDDGLPMRDKDLVRSQNERINESVLDANNNLRNHSLGLLEMKASAAFLRQIDLVDIDAEEFRIDVDREDRSWHEYEGVKRLNIIKAFKAPIRGQDYALGYRFYLQKPKEFLFVGDKWCELFESNDRDDRKKKEQQKNDLLRLGIQFVSASKFKESLDAGEAFVHQFLVYDTTSEAEALDRKNQTLLPLRIISDNEGNLTRLIQEGKQDHCLLTALKEEAWKAVVPELVTIKAEVQPSAEKQVVLKHHKDAYSDEFKKVYKSRSFHGKEVWIENLTSRTMSKMPEFASRSSNPQLPVASYAKGIQSQEWIVRSLYEAYHGRVIIIDERVQQYAEENKEDCIPCYQLFESTNICVPRRPVKVQDGTIGLPPHLDGRQKDRVIPLAPDDFSAYVDKVMKYIDRRIMGSYLIIHYGVLERMFNKDEELISQKLERWAKKAKRVVVTSGRGSHSILLPDTVCFVSLSSVLYACSESRNKYMINYLVNQARRKR